MNGGLSVDEVTINEMGVSELGGVMVRVQDTHPGVQHGGQAPYAEDADPNAAGLSPCHGPRHMNTFRFLHQRNYGKKIGNKLGQNRVQSFQEFEKNLVLVQRRSQL